MTCTSCRNIWLRRGSGRAAAARGERLGPWTDEDTEEMRAAGWFVYHRHAHVRFSGVVLCPSCRQMASNSDAFGRYLPTAELERAASEPASASAGGGR